MAFSLVHNVIQYLHRVFGKLERGVLCISQTDAANAQGSKQRCCLFIEQLLETSWSKFQNCCQICTIIWRLF